MYLKLDVAKGTYHFTFAPWISEETIRRAYRSLHENDNRPLGSKVLFAFRFVDEHTEPGQTPKWAQLTRLWNARNPEPEQTFGDGCALKRAYERAEMRLASSWADQRHRAVDRASSGDAETASLSARESA